MNFRPGGARRTRDFELVPLIDVVFTLLLFFALTTTFQQPEPPEDAGREPADPKAPTELGAESPAVNGSDSSIDIQLPRAGDRGVLESGRVIQLELRADGGLRVGGQEVSMEALGAALKDAARRSPETTVVLRADESASHGRVVAVMDLARELGLSDFAIATTDP